MVQVISIQRITRCNKCSDHFEIRIYLLIVGIEEKSILGTNMFISGRIKSYYLVHNVKVYNYFFKCIFFNSIYPNNYFLELWPHSVLTILTRCLPLLQ